MPHSSEVADARLSVLDRIADAAWGAGRSPEDVTLVAVSKQQPDEKIDAMLAAGQTVFGENRVQEAMGRWIPRREGVELRLIGPLQTGTRTQFLLVLARQADAPAYEDVAEAVRAEWARHEAERALAALLQRLRRNASLRVSDAL